MMGSYHTQTETTWQGLSDQVTGGKDTDTAGCKTSKANCCSSSQPSCKESNGISLASSSKPIASDDLKAEALKLRERVRSGCTLKAISKNEEQSKVIQIQQLEVHRLEFSRKLNCPRKQKPG